MYMVYLYDTDLLLSLYNAYSSKMTSQQVLPSIPYQ
jgi:hypothetical protein